MANGWAKTSNRTELLEQRDQGSVLVSSLLELEWQAFSHGYSTAPCQQWCPSSGAGVRTLPACATAGVVDAPFSAFFCAPFYAFFCCPCSTTGSAHSGAHARMGGTADTCAGWTVEDCRSVMWCLGRWRAGRSSSALSHAPHTAMRLGGGGGQGTGLQAGFSLGSIALGHCTRALHKGGGGEGRSRARAAELGSQSTCPPAPWPATRAPRASCSAARPRW